MIEDCFGFPTAKVQNSTAHAKVAPFIFGEVYNSKNEFISVSIEDAAEAGFESFKVIAMVDVAPVTIFTIPA